MPPTPPRPPGAARRDPRRWVVLGVMCLSLLLIVMDNTIVNVALPTLQRDLGASTSQLQWIVDSYILVFAGLLLTMGVARRPVRPARRPRHRPVDHGLGVDRCRRSPPAPTSSSPPGRSWASAAR